MKRFLALLLALVICLSLVPGAFAGHKYSATTGICRKGDYGDNVRKLQNGLINLGYLDGRADGKFGELTEDALRRFQRCNGFCGDISLGKVATPFTYAVLYGDNAVAAWSKNARYGYISGDYAIYNSKLTYPARAEGSFQFCNREYETVDAICIYYWLTNEKGNYVNINGYRYYYQWSSNLDLDYNEKVTINIRPDVSGDELRYARNLCFIIGEIAYEDGEVAVVFDSSIEPYRNRYYSIGLM